jgi:tetratricopeptide (TPR) repeat protein
MAKKKNQKHVSKTPLPPEPLTPPSSHKPLRIIVVISAVFIFALLAYFFFVRRHVVQPTNLTLKKLENIDFNGSEPQVAEKITTLKKQLSKKPKSAAAWGKLAMNLDIHDFKQESVIAYKQAAGLDPKDFRWPYYLAIVLDEMGSAEALQFFDQSAKLNPKYAATYLRYGDALLQFKQNEEALQQFNAALSIENSSNAHVGLARIALSKGDLNAAREHLEKATQANPRHGEVHGLLSDVYRRLNNQEEANRELQLAQQLPKKKPLQDKLELELIGEGVSSYWYELRGRAYLDQGYLEDAINELKLAVQYSPKDARLFSTLGVAYLQAQKNAEAAQQLRASLDLDPNSVNAMNNLASALFEMGRTDEAIQWVNKAIEQEPEFAGSYDHLGRLLLRADRNEEALKAYENAMHQFPHDQTLALQLAWMLATSSESNLRNPKKSFQLADGVCKRNKYTDPQCLYVLAAAYADTGDFAGAIKLASRADQMAMMAGQTELSNQIKGHLKSYEEGKPIRE